MNRWHGLSATQVHLLSAGLAVLAILSALYAWGLNARLVATHAELAKLRAAPQKDEPKPGASNGTADFTSQFAVEHTVDAVLDNAIREAARLGVRVKGASSPSRSEGTEALPQAEFVFELQASYATLKAWLAEVTARHGGLAIASIDLRRADPSSPNAGPAMQSAVPATEVAATIRLRLYSRPPKAVR